MVIKTLLINLTNAFWAGRYLREGTAAVSEEKKEIRWYKLTLG